MLLKSFLVEYEFVKIRHENAHKTSKWTVTKSFLRIYAIVKWEFQVYFDYLFKVMLFMTYSGYK